MRNTHTDLELPAQGTTYRRDAGPADPTTVRSPGPARSTPINIPRAVSDDERSTYHPITREYRVIEPAAPRSNEGNNDRIEVATSGEPTIPPPKPPRIYARTLSRPARREDLPGDDREYLEMAPLQNPVRLTEEARHRLDQLENEAHYELTI